MKAVIPYVPMHEIKLYNGETYFLESSKMEAFEALINKSKFVKIQGVLINVSSIDRCIPAGGEKSEIQNAILSYPSQYHEKLRKFVKDREKEEKSTTPGNIRNYYEQVLIG